MKMTSNEAAAWLSERDHFCILTHTRPDGDTMGSSAALCLGLRQLGKTAHVLENKEASPFFAKLHAGLSKPEPEPGDVIVTTDVASVNMLPAQWQALAELAQLRIDHHASATSFTPLELVDAKAAACGEILYDVLMAMGVTLDEAMGTALYVAVSTDTGCFRYANTEAHTYEVAAECAKTGACLYPITQELFDTNSFAKLKLQSWIVEHTRFLADGKAAVCAIPKELESTVSKDDLEGLSGFLRSIEGIKISATLREIEGGSKMSVRAVPGYDATRVCTRFGGGGHTGAAGASVALPLEAAAQLVADALVEVAQNP